MNLQKQSIYIYTKILLKPHEVNISIDLIRPYSTTSQGNSYALTAVWNLTGYLMTTPLPDKKTTVAAVLLFSEIMLKFGFPQILHSDNRAEFNSKLIEQLTTIQHNKNLHIPVTPPSKGKIRIFTQIP